MAKHGKKADQQEQELKDALAREAATAEILRVISSSPEDTQPVFETIVKSGSTLFPDAAISVALPVGDEVQAVAVAESDPARAKAWQQRFPFPLTREYMHGLAILESRVIDIPDVTKAPDQVSAGAQNFLASGYRAVTMMPLMRGSTSIGVLSVVRLAPGPLSREQVALLRTFAAQAVIAIENVRQFRELQTRLERGAATSEILGAISQYRDDEIPVFEAILENAARLCRAPHAFLQLRNAADSHLEIAAQNFATSSFLDRLRANPIPIHNNEGSISVRGMNAATPTQYEDIRLLRGTDLYTPQLGFAMDTEGMRTALFVPLITERKGIGVIILYKHEVEPFTADEINLVETFAAQAVIAIENVKQFKALEKLNAELGDRVKEQVGEIERMGRLKRFLPVAVADAVVSQGSDKMLSSHRALLGVLFCDIRGFTAFCETSEPEETIEVLQTYHEEMGKLISSHGAGVDHRMGDGIMVLFNDPLPCDDPAGDAIRLAIAMRERMAELCAAWKRMGYRLGFGVGVSLGYATVGMVGFEGRFDYTASGTAINLASRLCDEASDGEILLSPRASIAVEDSFQVESRGELSLKGIREPLEIFKLAGTVAT